MARPHGERQRRGGGRDRSTIPWWERTAPNVILEMKSSDHLLAVTGMFRAAGFGPLQNYVMGATRRDGTLEEGAGVPGPIEWVRLKLGHWRRRYYLGLLLAPGTVVVEKLIPALPEWSETMESFAILEALVDTFPPLSALSPGVIAAEYNPNGFRWPPQPTDNGFALRTPAPRPSEENGSTAN